MHEEFNLGPMKLIHDEDGYGIAHEVPGKKPKEYVWEVIATFKHLGDFMRFLSNHLLSILQQEETAQIIHGNISQVIQNLPKPESKDESN